MLIYEVNSQLINTVSQLITNIKTNQKKIKQTARIGSRKCIFFTHRKVSKNFRVEGEAQKSKFIIWKFTRVMETGVKSKR